MANKLYNLLLVIGFAFVSMGCLENVAKTQPASAKDQTVKVCACDVCDCGDNCKCGK